MGAITAALGFGESILTPYITQATADSTLAALVPQIEITYPGFSTLPHSAIVPTATNELAAFAADPYKYVNARPTAWETTLPSSLRSAYDSYITSVVYAEASVVRSSLGFAATPITVGSNAAPTAGKEVYMAAGAVAASAAVVGLVL